MNRVNVGIEGVDKLLKGGLPPGRTVLVSGNCGTGKSTFGAQFIAEGARNKERGVFVTFEESKDKLRNDMMKFGIDLRKLEEEKLCKVIGGPIATIRHFQQRTRAKSSDIVDEIREVVEETGAKRVVLDSLNLYTMLFETIPDKRIATAELCATLSALGCTSLLTCETREGSQDLSWYGFEEFVVDGVIVLYNFMSAAKSNFTRAITIRKIRGLDHDKAIHPYEITNKGLVVYPSEEVFMVGKKDMK